MNKLHEKSLCCQAKIYKIGGKRKQCSRCKKIWTNWKSKRGRKIKRTNSQLLERVLNKGERTTHIAARSKSISRSGLCHRLNKTILKTKRTNKYPPGWLIILADGIRFFLEHKYWTLYVIAVRSTNGGKAYFLDPVLLSGKESLMSWKIVFESIPKEIRNRVLAIVSDGFRGVDRTARKYGWICQRCHFHLLAQLQVRLGFWKNMPDHPIRKEIYETVGKLLKTINNESKYSLELYELINSPHCPYYYRRLGNELLRRLTEFRNYVNYPELNLPNTTNCMESFNNIIRDRCKYQRTSKSLQLRSVALTRTKFSVTCNNKKMINFTHN
ncbi:MAG: transposase [Patescibacteria group bacterium]